MGCQLKVLRAGGRWIRQATKQKKSHVPSLSLWNIPGHESLLCHL